MGEQLDLNQSVYSLCTQHPDLVNVLSDLGFSDITGPGMLQTAGRFMTLTKGAAMKGINMETIRARFIELGYDLKGEVV